MEKTANNDDLIREEFSNFIDDMANELSKEQNKEEKEEKEKYDPLRKYYVYALCEIIKDDNEKVEEQKPFYIGKGTGDRVWNHADETEEREELKKEAEDKNYSQKEIEDLENQIKQKHKKISELGRDNISYIIIKSGLTEYESFMCESALINLLKLNAFSYCNNKSLTNIVNGHSNNFEKKAGINTSALSVEDYFKNYCKKPINIDDMNDEQKADFDGKKILLQNINQAYNECIDSKQFATPEEQNEAIREAVRGFWGWGKPDRMDYVFAMYGGRIKGVYKVVKKTDDCDFKKMLDISDKAYPYFSKLNFRRLDNEIATAIVNDLKNNPKIIFNKNKPYEGLDKKHIYELISDRTRELCKNAIDRKDKKGKPVYKFGQKPNEETENEYYNKKLKYFIDRKYFVLEDIKQEDIDLGKEPDFYKYINCSIKENRIDEEKPVNIFTGEKSKKNDKKRSKAHPFVYLPKTKDEPSDTE